ncbi:unnamed protein product, partial [Ixodes hexagonus]
MGRKCFAPNCNSGYRSCKEKVNTFRAPSDPERLALWARAIPRSDRQLTPKDYLCEKHFADGAIEAGRYYAELGGEVLLDQPKRPVLAPDAVPSIFPGCPPYLSSTAKKRKLPKNRQRAPATVVKRRKTELQDERNEGTHFNGTTSNVVTEDTSADRAEPGIAACTAGYAEADTVGEPSTHMVREDDSINDIPARVPAKPSKDSVPFRSVLPEKNVIVMPSKSWACHEVDVEGLQNLCCVEMKSTSAIEPPFASKILTLEQCRNSLKVRQYVLDREVNSVLLQAKCPSQTAHDITEMVNAFDQKPVFAGGPAYKMFPGIHPECASTDKMGMWRHNRCPLLLNETELRCTFCTSLSNTLRIHKARLEKRGKEQRVRMPLSPSKKKKIDILRRQRIACSRSKVRLLKRKRELEAELSMCKKDLEQLSSE